MTPQARASLEVARIEADRYGHLQVGTEHLLLGLIAHGSGRAREILANETLDVEVLQAKLRQELEGDLYSIDQDVDSPLERIEAMLNELAPDLTPEGLHLVLWMVAEKIKKAGDTPTLDPLPIPGVDETPPQPAHETPSDLEEFMVLASEMDSVSLGQLQHHIEGELHSRSPEGQGEAHFRQAVSERSAGLSQDIQDSLDGVRFICAAILLYLGEERVRVQTPPDLVRSDVVTSRIRTTPDAGALGKNFYVKRELPDGHYILKIQRGKKEEEITGGTPQEVVEGFSSMVTRFCMLNK